MQTMSYSSTDQWPQYYNHQNSYNQSAYITTSSTTPLDYRSNGNGSGLRSNSEGCLRPTKRKSRASKRSPTTIFTADVANFRALVQQLTGRPRVPIGVVGSTHKGPLNINFAKGSAGNIEAISPTKMPYEFDNLGNNIITQNLTVKKDEYYGKRCGFVEHEDMMSSCNVQGVATSSSRGELAEEYPKMIAEAFDDFNVDDLCLEELAWVANGDI